MKGKVQVRLVRGPFLKLAPHPHAVETDKELLALARTIKKPLAADLFCGAGGLSLGLAQAGFEVILGIDHDDDSLETHRAYHPGLSLKCDLGDENEVDRVAGLIKKAGIRLIAGGPPCQPFSRAGRSMVRELVRTGRRPHHDHRRDLWESFLAVIEQAEPDAVLMENVPDMALDRGMVILRTMTERLESLGYSVEERVINTAKFGVPQYRHRLIMVALRDGTAFRWPDEAAARVTVENAIGDLPPVEGGWRPDNGDGEDKVGSGWATYSGPITDFQKRARDGVGRTAADRVYDHITRPVREDDALAFAQMDSTTRYSDLDPELKRYRDDIFDDKYKRLDPNDVSRTITAHIAKDGYWYIHPFQDRTITVREAARLQTFPDWFRFAGAPTAAFRQIGNAVPVALGRILGEAILRSLREATAAAISTRELSQTLATWLATTPPVHLPWLEAVSRWQVIQAELLWDRIGDEQAVRAWQAIRNLTTPEETLDAMPLIRRLAGQWNRAKRCDELEQAARYFSANPELLHPDVPFDSLTEAPFVTTAIADMACRIVPGETEDPVLVSHGLLRVAARYQGLNVDRQNKMSDGRLAIARMIGAGDSSHDAHLALFELAAGHCGITSLDCAHCPLEKTCVTAANSYVQTGLPVHQPS